MLGWLKGSIPRMYDKAYRWVAEMEEIPSFVGTDLSDSDVYAAFAKFYNRMAADNDGAQQATGALTAFLQQGVKT